MPIQVACPTCGAGCDDSDASCPACGFVNPAGTTTEELIATWVVTSSSPDSGPAARDTVCVACGYEGTMVPSPDRDRDLCPACGNPWQDRGGIIKKMACPDCGQLLLLTEQDRGKTILCPGCHSVLGCLIEPGGRKRARGPTIFDMMALAAAFALGYTVSLTLWDRQVAWPLLNGTSVVVLPITLSLVALRVIGPRMSRWRRFDPPGVAACLAVSVASLLNGWNAWDVAFATPTVPYDAVSVAALRVVDPLPLAAAVTGTWALLILGRRWRPERSWIDRLGRCLAIYWVGAGLVVPFLRLLFP